MEVELSLLLILKKCVENCVLVCCTARSSRISLANTGAVVSVLDGPQGCDPALQVVRARFLMFRGCLAQRPGEIRTICMMVDPVAPLMALELSAGPGSTFWLVPFKFPDWIPGVKVAKDLCQKEGVRVDLVGYFLHLNNFLPHRMFEKKRKCWWSLRWIFLDQARSEIVPCQSLLCDSPYPPTVSPRDPPDFVSLLTFDKSQCPP